jgi:hypothetical protein
LESGMSMDFLSMFASNVWNIIIHKSIVRYIVTVVKMYSLNLSQHSQYDINLYYKSYIADKYCDLQIWQSLPHW